MNALVASLARRVGLLLFRFELELGAHFFRDLDRRILADIVFARDYAREERDHALEDLEEANGAKWTVQPPDGDAVVAVVRRGMMDRVMLGRDHDPRALKERHDA